MKLYLKSGKYQEPILELEHSILHMMFYKFHPTSSIPTPPHPLLPFLCLIILSGECSYLRLSVTQSQKTKSRNLIILRHRFID